MKRIHESLERAFQRNQIVFWYDPESDWKEAFDTFSSDDVIGLRVAGNEFGAKVQIARESNGNKKFLVYVPSKRPPDSENWLLDLLLQGHEFRADKASLILEDVGLPHEYRHLVEDHANFFNSVRRVQALRDSISDDDSAPDIRLKMMAVTAGTGPDFDALLLHFLDRGADQELIDPVEEDFASGKLVGPFWREIGRIFGYTADAPNLRDFAVSLFRGANPLDLPVEAHPHSMVFLRRWKDSQSHCESFRRWAHQLEDELQVEASLNAKRDHAELGVSDTFELFERFTIHRLCQGFAEGAAAGDLLGMIQERRGSFWRPEHEHGYAALEHAIELRELLDTAELTLDSVEVGMGRYIASWWRIDMAYRRCTYHLRHYGQVQVMEQVAQWVEKTYVNNFLLPLADRWSDQVKKMPAWKCESLLAQREFFESYVQPFGLKGQKVFVIVSDALRYEAAAEFADRLSSTNRWTAELEAMFGSLPSYTQLGMASLLPGKEWAVDEEKLTATVDGRSATGTNGRDDILRSGVPGLATTAIQAEDFLEMNTKVEGRALTRDHDIIYIFHNHIDKVGDDLKTEGRTLDAVEKTFEELDLIIRKVANINGNNMLLTADHGFLFQQDEVVVGDMIPLPAAKNWTNQNRRFAVGRGIPETPGTKIFSAKDLGLTGDWSAAFPLSLGRFPLRGAGKRFVHGGISIQEVLVPVVRIHKARADDTERVGVDLLRVPAKITTSQVSVALFQNRAVGDKVLPRTLRIGIFADDGTPLSEVKPLIFDSSEKEVRKRETTVLLTLSHDADAHNNRDVELRLQETVPGTSQTVTYKAQTLKLQKPFASDFDEF